MEHLATISEHYSSGFPNATQALKECLSQPDTRHALAEDVRAFAEAYAQDRSLLRFHFQQPNALLNRLVELKLPRRDYVSVISDIPQEKGFITQDEIEAALVNHSVYENGNRQINAYFQENHTQAEKARFAQEHYGIGGRSHALSGAQGSSMDFDSKGIRFQKKDCDAVLLSWNAVAKRIDELIASERYLPSELTEPITTQPVQEAIAIEDSVLIEPAESISSDVQYARESLIPNETMFEFEGRSYLVDRVNEKSGTVNFQDITFTYATGFPIFRNEPIAFVRRMMETSIPEPEPLQNFRITDDRLGEGTSSQKYAANMVAIRTLKTIEAENRAATPDEQEALSRYVGWGGLSSCFEESHLKYDELKTLLTDAEYEAARASTLNAHYTSPTVINAIYEAVGNMGFIAGNILEPACGVGNFFGLLPDSMTQSSLYGTELDSITGHIAQKLYPNADIQVAGFETTDRRDFYDLAIGNVPFGQYQVDDKAYNKLGFSIHNYFFAKAIDQVRPGGVIAFVTSRYTMDQKSPDVRRYIAERAELLGAIRLPNNAFKANAGTDVVSDILFLQKRDAPMVSEPDWVHLGVNADGHAINSYFIDHPEMILGTESSISTQYGKQDFTVVPVEGAVLSKQLHEAVGHIHGELGEWSMETERLENQGGSILLPADPNVKNFSYTVVDGDVYYRENSHMVRPELNPTAKERIKGLVAMASIKNACSIFIIVCMWGNASIGM